jgi:lipopolysaccharide export LptBFGC system permease protein LptF
MLRIHRALIAELVVVFGGVSGVVTAVVFAGSTIGLAARGEGMAASFLVEMLPHLLPIAAAYSLPFSWLAAVTLVIGRMVNDREVTALRTSGVHVRTLIVPVLAFGAVVSTLAMGLNGYGLPEANRSIAAGVRRYLPVFLTSLKDVDRSVTLSNGRFSFARYAAGSFWDVELDRRNRLGALEFKVLARRVTIELRGQATDQDALRFTFEDGYVLQASPSGEPSLGVEPESGLQMGRVDRIGASVLFNEFFGTRRFVERPRDLTVENLLYASRRDGIWRGARHSVHVWMHRALALAWAPFAMGVWALGMALLLGPTGRRVRDFLLGFLPPVLLYFPLFLPGPPLGLAGHLPPWIALWAANLCVAALGTVVLVVASRR